MNESEQPDNQDIFNRVEDVYYEVRIGTAMMILIVLLNLVLVSLGLLGFVYLLD